MVEYALMAFKDISISLNGKYSVLLPYFILGGIVMVVIGYWIKKKIGAFIALLLTIFAYLYFSGSFDHII